MGSLKIFMKIKPTTSLNDAVKTICAGHSGAATVVGHIVKEFPSRALKWIRIMEEKDLSGRAIWTEFSRCGGDISIFLKELSRRNVK